MERIAYTLIMNPLGPALKSIRERAGLTQDQIAKALTDHGVDISTRGAVSKIEDRDDVKHSIVRAWADICKVAITDIETEAEAQATSQNLTGKLVSNM